jgi:hypothetical protein
VNGWKGMQHARGGDSTSNSSSFFNRNNNQ